MKVLLRCSVGILLLTVCVSLLASCLRRPLVVEKQTEYHEEIYDLEMNVLENLGDYISIQEPIVDSDTKNIKINATFITAYVEADNKDKTYLEVMEEFRNDINLYLEDNPDSFLNDDYYIRIEILRAPQYYNSSIPYETYGVLCNRLSSSGEVESTLCNVEYTYILDEYEVSDVSFEGIRQIDLENSNNTDSILQLLANMPDIEIVLVRDELKPYLQGERPDVTFK